jgi:hypothetical protein
MSRDPEDLELDGDITISAQPLRFTQAEDLLPDMIGIGGIVVTQASSALDEMISAVSKSTLRKLDVNAVIGALGPLLTALAERLKAGELKRLAPLILNSTAVVFPDDNGVKMRLDLSKKSEREQAFEAHPELYFIAIGFAAKVTFSKYFPAIGPLATKLKSLMAKMMPAPSHPEAKS